MLWVVTSGSSNNLHPGCSEGSLYGKGPLSIFLSVLYGSNWTFLKWSCSKKHRFDEVVVRQVFFPKFRGNLLFYLQIYNVKACYSNAKYFNNDIYYPDSGYWIAAHYKSYLDGIDHLTATLTLDSKKGSNVVSVHPKSNAGNGVLKLDKKRDWSILCQSFNLNIRNLKYSKIKLFSLEIK